MFKNKLDIRYKINVTRGCYETTFEHLDELLHNACASQADKSKDFCMKLGSHTGGYEQFYLLGYKAVQSVESQHTFRINKFPACHLFSSWFLSWFILRPWRWWRHVPPKRRADFQRTARRYITGERTLLPIYVSISTQIKNRGYIKPNTTTGKTEEKWETTNIWNSWLRNRGSLPECCINKCFNTKCVKRKERTATMGNAYWLAMEIYSMRKKTDLSTKTTKTFPNVMIKQNRKKQRTCKKR
jgi:hypothetical protein